MQEKPINTINSSHKMSSSIMKSLLMFLLVLLQLLSCSSAGWIFKSGKAVKPLPEVAPESNLAGRAGAPFKDAPYHLVHEAPINTLTPKDKLDPSIDHSQFINSVDETVAEKLAMAFGEKLAMNLFGPRGKSGFRWGKKLGNRIHSAAGKCKRFFKELTPPVDVDSWCPKPFGDSPLLPNSDIAYCIIEVTNLGNGECLPAYESDTIPPEATCSLEVGEKIDPHYCSPDHHSSVYPPEASCSTLDPKYCKP